MGNGPTRMAEREKLSSPASVTNSDHSRVVAALIGLAFSPRVTRGGKDEPIERLQSKSRRAY